MDKWQERDQQHVWHPYTQMKEYHDSPPILIERAEGFKLFDNNGNFYYDTISSWWCNIHGHNHPKINEAIKTQLNSFEHVLFAGFTHKPAIELAEKLVNITSPNLTKVFYSDNGSTAVEVALKMSFQYWHNIGKPEKQKFVSLDCGYHGDTIGTMSVSGVDLFNEVFSPLFYPSFKVPTPYCYRCPLGLSRESCDIDCLAELEKTLKNHHQEIAAMIIEPLVVAAGGMIIYEAEYLKKVRELTSRYDVHLILDEVATGFGRTGKMFAYEHADIQPDMICLSKGITGGYLPLGATLTTDDIYDAFYADYAEKKTFYHGHTFTANPISCVAGLASLEIFEEDDTLNNIQEIIAALADGLEGMRDLEIVGDVRHLGMIGALELVKDKSTKTPFSFAERIGQQIYKKGLAHNLILRPLGNIVYLYLPLITTKKDLDYILKTTRQIISSF